MTKEEFIKYLEAELFPEKILITDDTDSLQGEISRNFRTIGMDNELASQFTIKDLNDFFDDLILNRRQQLNESKCNVDLLFYLWFDGQAGQLRFNFINSNHSNLPFGCKLNIVDNKEIIFKEFFESPYLEGIPWEELKDIKTEDYRRADEEEKKMLEEYVLNVYQLKIIKETG